MIHHVCLSNLSIFFINEGFLIYGACIFLSRIERRLQVSLFFVVVYLLVPIMSNVDGV